MVRGGLARFTSTQATAGEEDREETKDSRLKEAAEEEHKVGELQRTDQDTWDKRPPPKRRPLQRPQVVRRVVRDPLASSLPQAPQIPNRRRSLSEPPKSATEEELASEEAGSTRSKSKKEKKKKKKKKKERVRTVRSALSHHSRSSRGPGYDPRRVHRSRSSFDQPYLASARVPSFQSVRSVPQRPVYSQASLRARSPYMNDAHPHVRRARSTAELSARGGRRSPGAMYYLQGGGGGGPVRVLSTDTYDDAYVHDQYDYDLEYADERSVYEQQYADAINDTHVPISDTRALSFNRLLRSNNKDDIRRRIQELDYEITALKTLRGPDNLEVAQSLHNRAILHQLLKNYTEAQAHFEEALHIRRKMLGPSHPRVGDTLYNLGVLYKGQKKYDNAYAYYTSAYEVYSRAYGSTHQEAIESLHQMEKMRALQSRGRKIVCAIM